jgi:DNA-binding response OmpR family regulator
MSSHTYTRMREIENPETILQAHGGEEQFAERRRISLLESDTALRPVLIGILLRLGCVVSARRELAQVIEALQTGPLDGAIVALEPDHARLAALCTANQHNVPIVVLMDSAVDPLTASQFPGIHFLQKPFDVRQLLAKLNLPEKATILTER